MVGLSDESGAITKCFMAPVAAVFRNSDSPRTDFSTILSTRRSCFRICGVDPHLDHVEACRAFPELLRCVERAWPAEHQLVGVTGKVGFVFAPIRVLTGVQDSIFEFSARCGIHSVDRRYPLFLQITTPVDCRREVRFISPNCHLKGP
jgi:hypothetical protein